MLTGADELAFFETEEGGSIEVAVESENTFVSEQDGGAIVTGMGIVGEGMDGGVERGEDRSAGGSPEIEAEVDATVVTFGIGKIGATAVEGAVFGVATNGIRSVESGEQGLDVVDVCFGEGDGADVRAIGSIGEDGMCIRKLHVESL